MIVKIIQDHSFDLNRAMAFILIFIAGNCYRNSPKSYRKRNCSLFYHPEADFKICATESKGDVILQLQVHLFVFAANN